MNWDAVAGNQALFLAWNNGMSRGLTNGTVLSWKDKKVSAQEEETLQLLRRPIHGQEPRAGLPYGRMS